MRRLDDARPVVAACSSANRSSCSFDAARLDHVIDDAHDLSRHRVVARRTRPRTREPTRETLMTSERARSTRATSTSTPTPTPTPASWRDARASRHRSSARGDGRATVRAEDGRDVTVGVARGRGERWEKCHILKVKTCRRRAPAVVLDAERRYTLGKPYCNGSIMLTDRRRRLRRLPERRPRRPWRRP